MADAAIHPNFSGEEFDKEKERYIEGLKSDEKCFGSCSSCRVSTCLWNRSPEWRVFEYRKYREDYLGRC